MSPNKQFNATISNFRSREPLKTSNSTTASIIVNFLIT